jgi:polynucleotide 5'-hydroxyl-kinase GRC3/NOL9
MDCDVGQPEYTVPGVISLVLISSDQPSLSTSHLQLTSPELMHFVGDVVTKHDPQYVMSAIQSLYSNAVDMVSEFSTYGCRKTDFLKRTNSSNTFTALDNVSSSRDSCLPLLINADGWIKGLGIEILSAIVTITSPTHVVHLTSPKNREVSVLAHLPADCVVYEIEPGRATASKTSSADLRHLRSVLQ